MFYKLRDKERSKESAYVLVVFLGVFYKLRGKERSKGSAYVFNLIFRLPLCVFYKLRDKERSKGSAYVFNLIFSPPLCVSQGFEKRLRMVAILRRVSSHSVSTVLSGMMPPPA